MARPMAPNHFKRIQEEIGICRYEYLKEYKVYIAMVFHTNTHVNRTFSIKPSNPDIQLGSGHCMYPASPCQRPDLNDASYRVSMLLLR